MLPRRRQAIEGRGDLRCSWSIAHVLKTAAVIVTTGFDSGIVNRRIPRMNDAADRVIRELPGSFVKR